MLLYDLGAFTRPRRAQVLAGFAASFTIGVTIVYLKSEELISTGQLYQVAVIAVGGLLLWSTSINEEIYKDDRPVAVACLRDTEAAAADPQGYDATVDKATMARKTVKLIEEDHRILAAVQSGVERSIQRCTGYTDYGSHRRVPSGL